jgi:hypothetical protein
LEFYADMDPHGDSRSFNHSSLQYSGSFRAELRDLLYWRHPFKSVIVLAVLTSIYISLSLLSIIACLAYAGLALLICSVAHQLYCSMFGGKQRALLDKWRKEEAEIIPIDKCVNYLLEKHETINNFITTVKNTLLLNDIGSAIKMGLFFWLMTFIGEWFNLLTLLYTMTLIVFTVPAIYEMYKSHIDAWRDLAVDFLSKNMSSLKLKIQESINRRKE